MIITRVVAGGVGRVELVLVVLVEAGEQESGSEGSLTAEVGVGLVDIADSDDELLDRHVLAVGLSSRVIEGVIGKVIKINGWADILKEETSRRYACSRRASRTDPRAN